jgi:hypothetical protein
LHGISLYILRKKRSLFCVVSVCRSLRRSHYLIERDAAFLNKANEFISCHDFERPRTAGLLVSPLTAKERPFAIVRMEA